LRDLSSENVIKAVHPIISVGSLERQNGHTVWPLLYLDVLKVALL
jgi:hypothetical protein